MTEDDELAALKVFAWIGVPIIVFALAAIGVLW